MTVVIEQTPITLAPQRSSLPDASPWHIRAVAVAIDVVPGLAVLVTMALTALTVPGRSGWWWMCASIGALAFLFLMINRLLLPPITGWSLGRAVAGIRVMGRDGAPCGPWRLLLRDVAHLLDTASLLVGWLWPLWDSRRRTFADLLLRTEVRRVDAVQHPRVVHRLTAVVASAAATACLGGAAVGAGVVYLDQWRSDQAREQLARMGPKIVVDMLSFEPDTLESDFERARSLATDRYRAQLTIQQEAVQEAGAVRNQYLVTDSSVLSAAPDRATMLLFMQGERGALPEQRPISATVRVVFEKSGGQWRVDDLAVVMKPRQTGGEK